MALEKQMRRFQERRVADGIRTIIQFGPFMGFIFLHLSGQLIFKTQQLFEHQIEGKEHPVGDFRNVDKHFHKCKNKTIFDANDKNDEICTKRSRKVVFLSF